MPNPFPASATPLSEEDRKIWESLKRAIALSSGFQSWQLEQQSEQSGTSVEAQIRHYLQETLETLAY